MCVVRCHNRALHVQYRGDGFSHEATASPLRFLAKVPPAYTEETRGISKLRRRVRVGQQRNMKKKKKNETGHLKGVVAPDKLQHWGSRKPNSKRTDPSTNTYTLLQRGRPTTHRSQFQLLTPTVPFDQLYTQHKGPPLL